MVLIGEDGGFGFSISLCLIFPFAVELEKVAGYYLKSIKVFKDNIDCQLCVYCSQVGPLDCINMFDKKKLVSNVSRAAKLVQLVVLVKW